MIKTRKLILPLLLGLASMVLPAGAQVFTPINQPIVPVGRSSVAWGDYDNDGDQDLLISGDPVTAPYTASVYRNDAGIFTDLQAGLTGIYNSMAIWGDYDGDGDMDILACGRNASNSKTYLYRNDDGTFTRLEIGLPAIGSDGAIAWGDADNDGDLDVLIAGNFVTKIFRNDQGVFTDMLADLSGISNAWVDWGDYDNDGRSDVFLMGDMGGILTSAIYRNTLQGFVPADATGIEALTGGSASWSDFDNDHDLDLAVEGFNEFLEPFSTVYSNLGQMQFMDLAPPFSAFALGSAAWADYDADGNADLLFTGQNPACGSMSSKVYQGDGNGQFIALPATLAGAERGSAAWADLDNDGDQDLIITGNNESGNPSTHLYRNSAGDNQYHSNLPPSAPILSGSSVQGHWVHLSWQAATDDHTPATALTYNVRIGTSPGGQEAFSSLSLPLSGQRLIPAPGNAGHNLSWDLQLPDGTYYWSAQCIDQSYSGSAFATEQSFSIINTAVDEPIAAGAITFTNPFDRLITLRASASGQCKIFDDQGRQMTAFHCPLGESSYDASAWPGGLYVLVYNYGQSTESHLLLKK